MPTISIFYGIKVSMNPTKKEHNPPHVHATYGEYEASFKIRDGELFYGKFPARASAMVKEFIEKYRSELIHMWESETYTKLEGLN